jgi:hypothetical protein
LLSRDFESVYGSMVDDMGECVLTMTKGKSANLTVRHLAVAGAAALLALVLGVGSAGAEAYRGTEAQRQACTPDVFRLCQSEVPNIPAIVACMKRQRSQLSPACRTAMAQGPRVAGHDSGHHHRSTHAERHSRHSAKYEHRRRELRASR